MYFVDENGMTVIIPFGGKIKKDKSRQITIQIILIDDYNFNNIYYNLF